MNFRKYMTKKNLIIGAVAGIVAIGGIIVMVINKKLLKEEEEEIERLMDEMDDDDFWDDVLDLDLDGEDDDFIESRR